MLMLSVGIPVKGELKYKEKKNSAASPIDYNKRNMSLNKS